jgi:hypothetical protein
MNELCKESLKIFFEIISQMIKDEAATWSTLITNKKINFQ